MGCCVSIIKYLMFIFNVLFWLAGGVLLGVGIYLKVDKGIQNVINIAGIEISTSAAVALIVFGSIMFIIGFFGCCGAIKENRCLLGIYFTLVLLIFIAQVGVSIWAFVSRSWIETEIQKSLNNTVINTSDTAFVASMNDIQQAFKCCGLVNGCSDWPSRAALGCTCAGVAPECVAPSTLGCTNGDAGSGNIYSTDCYDKIIKFIDDNIVLLAGVAIGIALFEIFGMAFAIIMCNNKKSEYETY